MAVEVDTNNGQLVLGTPEALFEHPRVTQFMPWGVSNDGRFLFTTSSFALAEDPIHIYVNWTELAPN